MKHTGIHIGPELDSSRPQKGEGSGRSSMARIQDDMFLRVVDETLNQAPAHPEESTSGGGHTHTRGSPDFSKECYWRIF